MPARLGKTKPCSAPDTTRWCAACRRRPARLRAGRPAPWTPTIDLGAGEVTLAADARRHQVRRIILVGHQVGAVDGGDALDAIRKRRCRRHDERPAHAVAHRADTAAIGLRLRVHEARASHRCRAPTSHWSARHVLEHDGHHRFGALRQPEFTRCAGSTGSAARRNSPRQRVAAPCREALRACRAVHVEQDDGVRALSIGMHDDEFIAPSAVGMSRCFRSWVAHHRTSKLGW